MYKITKEQLDQLAQFVTSLSGMTAVQYMDILRAIGSTKKEDKKKKDE